METFHIHKYNSRLLVSHECGPQTLGIVVDIGDRGAVDVNVYGIGNIRVNTDISVYDRDNSKEASGKQLTLFRRDNG